MFQEDGHTHQYDPHRHERLDADRVVRFCTLCGAGDVYYKRAPVSWWVYKVLAGALIGYILGDFIKLVAYWIMGEGDPFLKLVISGLCVAFGVVASLSVSKSSNS